MMDRQQMKILKAFHEATRSERGGEVVVRSGEKTSRVFFVAGRIAWVTASTVKRTFTDYLLEKTGLQKEEVQEVFEECRRSGANFGETIVEWNLLGEEQLRRLLLEHLTDCLLEVFCWDPVDSMFVPEERTYKGSLTFDLEELLENVLAHDSDGRLPFAGHAVADILEQLRTDREPTMPFMPAFTEDSGQPPAPAETGVPGEGEAPTTGPEDAPPADEAGESVAGTGEAEIAAARMEDAIPTVPPPVDQPEAEDDFVPRPPRSRTPWVVLAVFLAAALAGLFYLLAGEAEWRKTAPAADAGQVVAAAESPADAGSQPPAAGDGGLPATAVAVADAGQDAGAQAGEGDGPGEDGGTADGGDRSEVRAAAAVEIEDPDRVIAGAAGDGVATVAVSSRPRRARVFVDGVYAGKKTPCEIEVAAGRVHLVMVERRRYRPAFKKIKPKRNERIDVKFRLRRGRASRARVPLRLESLPPGARVLVNGRRLRSETPLTLRLRADRITKVQVVSPGREKWTGFLKPVPRQAVTVRVELAGK